MSWLSYIFPQRIFVTSSPFNALIRVNEEKGKYKLLVNGSRQSGEYIKTLWQSAVDALHLAAMPGIKKILVLGVGGGTVIHLIHKLYPQAQIVGVDIDAVMIDIGRKYFGLDAIRTLSFVCDDAEHFIHNGKRSEMYDLIFVDLYIGFDVPLFVTDDIFLEDIRRHLYNNGAVVINYLREPPYIKRADSLEMKLKNLFQTVATNELFNNRFLCGSMVKLNHVPILRKTPR